MMVLVVCLNPTLQKTLVFKNLREGEVNRSGEYYLDASGKGVNLSRVLEQLGVSAVQLTHAGGSFRDLFLSLAGKDGVQIAALDSGSEIRFCTTLLNREKGTTTELVEEPYPVASETEASVRSMYGNLLRQADTVVITGTRTPGYSVGLYPDMVRMAKDEGKTVVLDIRGDDLRASLPFKPDIVKINLAEFAGTFLDTPIERENIQDPSILQKVEIQFSRLWEEYGVCCITTNGGEDTLYYTAGNVGRVPIEKAGSSKESPSILNTTGCGDAFTAGFIAAWKEAGSPAIHTEAFSKYVERWIRAAHRAALLNALQVRPGRIR
jgi:1-phosphofructokinase/tagatose 6-phosphate kinase